MSMPHPNRLRSEDADPKRRLIGIALLPSAATLGNLLCGVLAIFCCLLSIRAEYFDLPVRELGPRLTAFFPSYVAIAAYLVVLAMIFDALDGRLARIARRTSEFGAQLDSIADIVSFGAAPILMFLTLLLRGAVPADGDAFVGRIEWRCGLLCSLVYVSCAAIRLARFNAENIESEPTQKKFSGLPVPGAAAALVALLVLHEDLVYRFARETRVDWIALVRWSIGPMAFALGLLMVSRFDYIHVFNVYVRREQPPLHLVWLVALIGLAWWWPQIVLVILAFAYVVSGLLLNLHRIRRGPTPSHAEREKAPIDMN